MKVNIAPSGCFSPTEQVCCRARGAWCSYGHSSSCNCRGASGGDANHRLCVGSFVRGGCRWKHQLQEWCTGTLHNLKKTPITEIWISRVIIFIELIIIDIFKWSQVGARCLETGSWGAYYNVLINLDNILDEKKRNKFNERAQSLLKKAEAALKTVLETVAERV